MRQSDQTIEELVKEASDELTNAGYHEAKMGEADRQLKDWADKWNGHEGQMKAHRDRFREIVDEIKRRTEGQ